MMILKHFLLPIMMLAVVVSLLHGTETIAAEEAKTMDSKKIRESVIAGRWYPGDKKRLRNTIQNFFSHVPEKSPAGKLIALISPHAGYPYSGQVAAYAYKLLEKQKFDTVIIIAPSHRTHFSGVSLYDQGGYQTPLGIVPLDTELVSALKEKDKTIRYVPRAHLQEHSLEIQLPFLQAVMPAFKLVPLVMGDQSLSTCQWLAKILADTIGNKSALIVASSDLSHFHDYEAAKKLDKVVSDKVRNFDPVGLGKSLETGECEACGGGPMITAMLTARLLGADSGEVLNYTNSGDVTGDHTRVVGYMAAAIWNRSVTKSELRNKENPELRNKETIMAEKKEKERTETDLGLTSEEKALLHKIVRETIEARIQGREPKKYDTSSETLKEARGAFVTLKKQGQLRGCIGHIIARYPLIETISKMAIAAAFEDPRFPPVKKEEFKELDIEISVLTPLRKISDVNEIQVGRHGIYIKKGFFSGILLPQVATEYGWDRNTFLEHTCMKAGLPPDAWKDKETEIYIYSADIF